MKDNTTIIVCCGIIVFVGIPAVVILYPYLRLIWWFFGGVT
jgi:hypothetical protein